MHTKRTRLSPRTSRKAPRMVGLRRLRRGRMGRSRGSTIGVPSGTCGLGRLDVSLEGGSAMLVVVAVRRRAAAPERARERIALRGATALRADRRVPAACIFTATKLSTNDGLWRCGRRKKACKKLEGGHGGGKSGGFQRSRSPPTRSQAGENLCPRPFLSWKYIYIQYITPQPPAAAPSQFRTHTNALPHDPPTGRTYANKPILLAA